MLKVISKLLSFLDVRKLKILFLYLSFAFFILSWVFWILHYKNIFYGNDFSWLFWLTSCASLFIAFWPEDFSVWIKSSLINKKLLYVFLLITIIYWISHLWNFKIAPWNENGLFDDAAWDIYFAKNHVFIKPFQGLYFDTVGYISREVVFHYYITVFFKLFGYNLLVFNISLLFLGFITVIFTALIVQSIFKNINLTLVSFLIINFFPLHYMHIFMGHRYAIAAPLMVASLYFLYTAYANKSSFRSALSSVFAVLCWNSAIMGKQFLYALVGLITLVTIFQRRIIKIPENRKLIVVWLLGFLVASIPIASYILFNYREYNLREEGLLKEFMGAFKSGGIAGSQPYLDQLNEILFGKISYRRQFLPDYPIIPFAYYLLLIPGLIFAFLRRRYELVLLSLIPTLGALVSGSYDFRVLLSVPAWVIAISFVFDFAVNGKVIKNKLLKKASCFILLAVLLAGLVPSIEYLWKVSRDTTHLWLLPHKDVGVSRFVQDIVVGSQNPSPELKANEFNRISDNNSYDVLFCPYSSYAIAHLYLQNYNDKKVLSLCNQGIQLLKSPSEVLADSKTAITSYKSDYKDLVLIWEVSDKSIPVIDYFGNFRIYGSDRVYRESIDNQSFSLYTLTISKENILQFTKAVSLGSLE